MTRDELIAEALAFAGAVEDYPFGEDLLTVKVGARTSLPTVTTDQAGPRLHLRRAVSAQD